MKGNLLDKQEKRCRAPRIPAVLQAQVSCSQRICRTLLPQQAESLQVSAARTFLDLDIIKKVSLTSLMTHTQKRKALQHPKHTFLDRQARQRIWTRNKKRIRRKLRLSLTRMMMTQTNRMTQMKRLRKREEPLRKQSLPQSRCLSQSNLKSKSRPQWLLRRLFLKFSSRLCRKWTLYLIFSQVSPQLPSHNSNLCNRSPNLTLDLCSSRSN